MFYRDDSGNYRTPELDAFEWLVYGFGTRAAVPPEAATLHQIHSDLVVAADGRCGRIGEGDALITSQPGRPVAVKTADCLPILLADPAHRAVAAVHAGWRGVVRQICRRTAESMCQHFGTRLRDLHAAVGPGIGVCCFEVGPEVAAEFGRAGRAHIDLQEEIRRQLVTLGVPDGQIYRASLCTKCRPEEFWSYRRDREAAGRMHSFAGIR